LRTHGRAALDSFWAEVQASGTPLIEPIPDDDGHTLVTFLSRGADVHNVVAVSPAWPSSVPRDNRLRRLADSDLWHRTLLLPSDLHFSYRLSVNDPMAEASTLTPQQMAGRDFVGQTDPLNTRSVAAQIGTTSWTSSLATLPDAPPFPWSAPQPGVPVSTVEEFNLHSARLGNERRVWIVTPPRYAADGEPYGLLVLLDGEGYRSAIPTTTLLENLLAAKAIAPLVAVLVSCIDIPTRTRELALHEPFVEFLADELIPWVRQHVRITTDPARTIVGGVSLGGLAAAFTAFRRPDIFGNVLSQSGSFWWSAADPERLTRQFVHAPRAPVRFYLEAGLLENRYGTPREGATLLVANQHLRDVLEAKGYAVHYRQFTGGHDFACWRGTFADGLQVLAGNKTPKAAQAPD
jgi:enterochelin esterase family protein